MSLGSSNIEPGDSKSLTKGLLDALAWGCVFLKRFWAECILAIILLLAAAWFLSNLEGGLDHDEARYAVTGYCLFTGGRVVDLGVTNNPPLIKYFMGLSQFLLGRSSFAVRLPSAIFAILTLALAFYIGRELWSPLTGLCSAAMLVSTFGFSRRAVAGLLDMGLTFFIILTCFILIKFKSKYYYYVLLGIASGCVLSSKFTGLFALIPVVCYVLYSAFEDRSPKAALQFFLTAAATMLAVYLPYLSSIDLVVKSALHAASRQGTSLSYGVWTTMLLFLRETDSYNPLYALGILASCLYLIFGGRNKKMLGLVGLSYYAGIHFMGMVHYRFILALLPPFAILAFGFVEEVSSSLLQQKPKFVSPKLPILIALLIIIISPYGLLDWRGSPSVKPLNISLDTKADQLASVIVKYSSRVYSRSGRRTIIVATQKHPSVLYYLGADPIMYVQSPHSPNPPPNIYKTKVALTENTTVIMYWIGFDKNVDNEVYRLLVKGRVDILAIHNFNRLKQSVSGKRILNYIDAYCTKMDRLGAYRIYYMRGVKAGGRSEVSE